MNVARRKLALTTKVTVFFLLKNGDLANFLYFVKGENASWWGKS